MVSLKQIDVASGNPIFLAEFTRGKVWLDKPEEKLYLYQDSDIRQYNLRGDAPNGAAVFRFDADDLVRVDTIDRKVEAPGRDGKDIPKFRVKRFWEFKFPGERATCFATDFSEETLFIGDGSGQIFIYDLKKKHYFGKIGFESRPVEHIRVLKDGSLIVFYGGAAVQFVKKAEIPLFSFLQDARSMYEVKLTIKLPHAFLSRIAINPQEDHLALVCDHRILLVLEIPTLKTVRQYTENIYIEFMDFLGNSKIVYTTMKEKNIAEGPFNVHAHLSSLSAFFDWRRYIIPSSQGGFFMRVTDRKSIKIYDLHTVELIGEIGIDIRNAGEARFSRADRFLFITNAERDRFAVYQLHQQ